MPAPVSATGFDLNQVLAAAQARPNGSQKAFYTSEVAGYIGADPNITIRVDGVLKYRAGITGSLTTSASGIELPTTFDEPPATNTADAITSDDSIVEIESTVTPGRKLILPLALASAANPDKLAISAALDGTNAMRATTILLLPPSLLDPQVATGNIIASVDRFIEQMTGASESSSKNWGGASWTNQQANIQCPSVDALDNMTSGGRGDIMTNNGGPDSIVPWNWADAGVGHNGSNNILEATGAEAWVLKTSFTGSWERLWGPTTVGGGYRWQNGNTLQWVYAVDRASISGSNIAGYPAELDNNGLEFWPPGFNPTSHRNTSLMAQCVAIHCRTLFRVRRLSASGTDNRSLARYRVGLGYDIMNSKQYNYSGSTANGTFARPEAGTYPGYAMDGGRSKNVIIPYDSSNPDAWYAIGVTSITPAYWIAGLGPPWAAAAGVSDWSTEKPEAKTPWCMTHTQFRNNPVPMPTL